MKYSTRLSDTIHILAFIALDPAENLTSTRIAESVKTNPAFVRQIMATLKRAGIITSVPGHAQPRLARSASEITMLDVYHAVEGDTPLLHLDTHVNPDCGVGANIQYILRDYYDQVQKQAEETMQTITLQDILDSYQERIASLA